MNFWNLTVTHLCRNCSNLRDGSSLTTGQSHDLIFSNLPTTTKTTNVLTKIFCWIFRLLDLFFASFFLTVFCLLHLDFEYCFYYYYYRGKSISNLVAILTVADILPVPKWSCQGVTFKKKISKISKLLTVQIIWIFKIWQFKKFWIFII